jgi:type IV secretory pathway TraG/TraD family ATPase VirD4
MAARFEPSPIWFGNYFDPDTETVDRQTSLVYGGERHVLLFGVNGAGKSTRFLMENLCTLKDRSIIVLDLGKGELTRQTIRARRKICGAENVKVVDPDGITGLPSDGHNPLAALDPDADDFSDRAALLADAMVEMESKDPHWSESAAGLLQAGNMWEVIEARREGRPPSLFRVRQLLTEPDEWEHNPDGKTETQVKGLAVNAAKMVKEGGEIIASLVGRFLREHGQNELSGIQSTFDTQSRFLLSPSLARDLEKNGADFRQLIKVPTTIYICLSIQQVTRRRRWTRMLITEALCEHFKPGDVNTLFILDEFRSSVGDLAIARRVGAHSRFWDSANAYRSIGGYAAKTVRYGIRELPRAMRRRRHARRAR